MEGIWREYGGNVDLGMWREYGGNVEGIWREYGSREPDVLSEAIN